MPRMRAYAIQSVQLLCSRAPYLFICVLPLVILGINASFLANPPGDPDPWFYYGHFTSLGAYRHTDVSMIEPYDYYQTRLPFILPGWIIFTIFSTLFARVVHYYLYYVVISCSLFYVLSRNTSRTAALLATVMMGTDIYFIKTTGWNYVDAGVLCYLSLTFAALTAAARDGDPKIWLAVAAFCFTCAIFTHLVAVISIIPVAGYAWYALPLERVGWRQFASFLIAALGGAIVCQIVFGILNVWIWGTDFFFLRDQIAIAQQELSSPIPTAFEPPLSELLRGGGWLVMQIAVFFASTCVLGAAAFRLVKLSNFQIYCFSSVAALYLFTYSLHQFHFSYFLVRQEPYLGFLVFSNYLAIGALIPSSISMRSVYIAATLFTVSLLVRLQFGGGTELPIAAAIPAWLVGLLIAAALGITGLVARKPIAITIIWGISILTLFVSWRFDRDDSVYGIHDVVRQLSGNNLPRFLFDGGDPLYTTTIKSVVSTFTERAYWLADVHFPEPSSELWIHNKIFVLSSKVSDNAAVERALAPFLEALKPLAFMHFQVEGGNLWVHEFEAVNAIVLPAQLEKFRSQRTEIPGAALPSLVGRIEGNARVAIAGQMPSGVLTYGPYAHVTAGTYDLWIRYSAQGAGNHWDVAVADATGQPHILRTGNLNDTGGLEQEIHTSITFANTVNALEVRTLYDGVGALKVSAVGLRLVHLLFSN